MNVRAESQLRDGADGNHRRAWCAVTQCPYSVALLCASCRPAAVVSRAQRARTQCDGRCAHSTLAHVVTLPELAVSQRGLMAAVAPRGRPRAAGVHAGPCDVI